MVDVLRAILCHNGIFEDHLLAQSVLGRGRGERGGVAGGRGGGRGGGREGEREGREGGKEGEGGMEMYISQSCMH